MDSTGFFSVSKSHEQIPRGRESYYPIIFIRKPACLFEHHSCNVLKFKSVAAIIVFKKNGRSQY